MIQKAMIVTAVFVGMLLGAPFWGSVSDKYGR
jgi:MFS family permease